MAIMSFMESMGTSSVPLIAAFFIGLMTAISPCPMATNITAIAYASKRIGNSRYTVAVGIFYTLGRMLTYVSIAAAVVWFGVNTQAVSFFLQKYGDKALGPMLLIIGVVMLDIVKFNIPSSNRINRLKESLAKKGFIGSFLLGVIFALAFCPFSAVLFFGMLIPIALKAGDGLLIPAVFAFATGLPVIIFSFMLVYTMATLGAVMNKVAVFERWMRKAVGTVFIIAGIYYAYLSFFARSGFLS